MDKDKDNNVQIELTKDEAIVLFDWLGRFNEMDNKNLFENQAEQRALWNLECVFEKELSEPFSMDYKAIVQNARDRLRNEE